MKIQISDSLAVTLFTYVGPVASFLMFALLAHGLTPWGVLPLLMAGVCGVLTYYAAFVVYCLIFLMRQDDNIPPYAFFD